MQILIMFISKLVPVHLSVVVVATHRTQVGELIQGLDF